jgi:tryptophan 7-halogenase
MTIVKKVVIVGGGSSAWMSAAYISKQCPYIEVTVVDKEIGTPIGVGEGTLLSFANYMKDCGFEKEQWFNAIDSTYKTGALFPDWVEKGTEIWHPFNMSPYVEGTLQLQDLWGAHQEYDFKTYGVGMYETAVKHNRIDSSSLASYGYHVDAGKLVTFFQNNLQGRINFIASDVVELIKDGSVLKAVSLADGSIVEGDLFIDCTGFKSILRTEKKRKELMGRVFCDTAVCGQIQYEDKDTEMRPYTRAQAVDHGWIWTIPTQARMGSGLIFNKNITDVEEAKDYLYEYWGGRLPKENMRVIDWTPYYLEDPWKDNVVCIGMSSGFIEPLESTGLALVQYQMWSLVNVIKSGWYSEKNVSGYNTEFSIRFEDCVDFVSSHYSKTNRTEKFWQYVKETYKPTAGILIRLKMLENGVLHSAQQQYSHVFSGANWTTWMTQMGYKLGNNCKLPKEQSEHLLLKQYHTVEKYRPNWSQHHATEIARSIDYEKFKNRTY